MILCFQLLLLSKTIIYFAIFILSITVIYFVCDTLNKIKFNVKILSYENAKNIPFNIISFNKLQFKILSLRCIFDNNYPLIL